MEGFSPISCPPIPEDLKLLLIAMEIRTSLMISKKESTTVSTGLYNKFCYNNTYFQKCKVFFINTLKLVFDWNIVLWSKVVHLTPPPPILTSIDIEHKIIKIGKATLARMVIQHKVCNIPFTFNPISLIEQLLTNHFIKTMLQPYWHYCR